MNSSICKIYSISCLLGGDDQGQDLVGMDGLGHQDEGGPVLHIIGGLVGTVLCEYIRLHSILYSQDGNLHVLTICFVYVYKVFSFTKKEISVSQKKVSLSLQKTLTHST